MGPSAIIRMSFVLAIFHTIVLLVILGRNTAASVFHDGCWGTKFFFVLAFFVGTMWINNEFFKGYMAFSRIVSIAFLVVQALLMLCVAYTLNELLVGNYEHENTNGLGCSGIIIIIITALITIGNLTWMVF
jgi:Serine incorporator (Serinc)